MDYRSWAFHVGSHTEIEDHTKRRTRKTGTSRTLVVAGRIALACCDPAFVATEAVS